ncbi:Hypp8733 [Branchiostoma lanceolatum]|uniref:Hypp8733 protein n=1 Tax=Branchiostoma lanceolatum TaxID=7740 RepID=A0A8J9ZAM6_BRALA|nr:Hypp8733 [Branchiostoma lanceolatum]
MGYGGNLYSSDWCIDAVPTGFREAGGFPRTALCNYTLPCGQPHPPFGLQLSQNHLASVPVEALLQLKALKNTYLTMNHIRTIYSNVKYLKDNQRLRVHLDNNKLRCDKKLTWFICNLPNLTLITDRLLLKCASPSVLNTIRNDTCQTKMDGSNEVTRLAAEDDVAIESYKHDDICIAMHRNDDTSITSLKNDDASVTSPKHDELSITSLNDDDLSITRPYNKAGNTGEITESPYTNDVPVSHEHTTEKERIIFLGGERIINKNGNSAQTLAMIGAVAVPLLLVLTSAGVIFIYQRRCGDEEKGESQKIEPYAVAYSDSAELQASDRSSTTVRQPNPASSQSPGDSEDIQPYAVAYDEDQGPESNIKPYAIPFSCYVLPTKKAVPCSPSLKDQEKLHSSMSNKARRMLVLLLIILKEAGPTAACSSSCSSECDCSSRGLTSVPQDLPANITQLWLEDNAITTLKYNTIPEINQSESPHQGVGNMQSLDSFGYLVIPPPLPPETQAGPQAGSQSEPADTAACTGGGRDTWADEAEYNDVISPSGRPQPASGQIQHLGSFNDGYEVPSLSLCPENGADPKEREGPQSHKYENSQMIAAAAKDAAAGPRVNVYENNDESVDNHLQTAAAPGTDSPNHYEPLRTPSSQQQHTYTSLPPHDSHH